MRFRCAGKGAVEVALGGPVLRGLHVRHRGFSFGAQGLGSYMFALSTFVTRLKSTTSDVARSAVTVTTGFSLA